MLRVLTITLASAIVVVACGGGVESSSSGTTPGGSSGADCPTDYCAARCSGQQTPLYPAQCQLPACSCLPGITPRNDWAGTYFIPNKVDAANLVLEADGTFRWTIDGCDFGAGDCGVWKRSQPHTITLLPAPGATTFQWTSGNAVVTEASVDVVGDPSGDLVMNVASPGTKPLAERWKKGRVCADCNGTGPIGQTQCSTPVERRCK